MDTFNFYEEVDRLLLLSYNDIAALLGMTQSAVSHQLRVLKQTRLVKHRREGKVVYYSLEDEHINNIFAQGLTHIKER